MRTIQMIGVMFDGKGKRESFPTLRELADDYTHVNKYSLGYLCDDDMFGDWLAIARDPHSLMYGNDDHEAMDETNYDAIVAELSATPVHLFYTSRGAGRSGYAIDEETIREAMEARVAVVEHVLIIAPRADDFDEADMDDLWNMATLRHRLADYPLLDEEAFYEREYAAWMEYEPTAFADEIRYAYHDNRDDYAAETALDEINDHADELLSILSQHLHYYEGFGGGYAPNFLAILGELMREPAPTDEEYARTTTAQDLRRVQRMMSYHTAQWITRTL